jgi:hypothetical protein
VQRHPSVPSSGAAGKNRNERRNFQLLKDVDEAKKRSRDCSEVFLLNVSGSTELHSGWSEDGGRQKSDNDREKRVWGLNQLLFWHFRAQTSDRLFNPFFLEMSQHFKRASNVSQLRFFLCLFENLCFYCLFSVEKTRGEACIAEINFKTNNHSLGRRF